MAGYDKLELISKTNYHRHCACQPKLQRRLEEHTDEAIFVLSCNQEIASLL